MSQSDTLLETTNLSMRFGGVSAISGVDFTLAQRELRCLIGPNGAGKSTFFKTLTGQLMPTTGKIFFKGKSIAGAHTHDIANLGIGIKTQMPSLFNGLSVTENVWLAARRRNNKSRATALVKDILEKISLANHADSIVGQLAHGQRQWTEIGMVLAGEPDLILLDEPAAGMTHEETVRTAQIIQEISSTSALIVVEHDMQFINMIADKVTVFNQGKILMEDSINAVMNDPRVRDIYLGKKTAG